MRDIRIRARALTPAVAKLLEHKGLISFIRHPGLGVRRGLKRDWYKGADFPARIHGFHSVTVTYTDIFLSSHPEGQDEIVFAWDAERKARPLYFVFSLHKRKRYLALLAAGKISAADYVAFLTPMNDPRFSSFIVFHDTVHCELTDRRGSRLVYPSFFVLEPRKLSVNYTREERYGVRPVLAR